MEKVCMGALDFYEIKITLKQDRIIEDIIFC